jgi:glyoxylase-like metal-dependent hydrolase (beta-lactamase superfamily II)
VAQLSRGYEDRLGASTYVAHLRPSLFPGGVGKTWQEGDFEKLLGDVRDRVFDVYGDSTVVYPGHGDDTTLGAERLHLAEWRARGWRRPPTRRSPSSPGRAGAPGSGSPMRWAATAAPSTSRGARRPRRDDEQTEALFDRVAREQGRLDILVNNAAIIRDEMMARTPFWE